MNIDFHAHLLPAADHGSDGLQTSLRQLQLAREAGMDRVIATPHFYPRHEELDTFLARRTEAAAALRQGDAASFVLLGAEVQLCRSLHRLERLEELCIEGTRVLLLELPPDFSLRTYEHTLDALLCEKKLTVVLAHIDRYDTQRIDFLLESGFLGQLNASSFCHFRTRRRSLDWAQSARVVALGSDIHGVQTGYREFLKAKKRLGTDYDALMQRTNTLLFGEARNAPDPL